MAEVYYIGGSPCSGKSTIAEQLAEKYSMYYFKVDDFLDDYVERGAEKGYETCSMQQRMTPEQIWMRDPVVQCETELKFYEETFAFAMQDLAAVIGNDKIITEGAAYLPELIKQQKITPDHYMAIIPGREFQLNHYRQREWVPYILEGCSDKEKAFMNWMERDYLFADEVEKSCKELGYFCYRNEGQMDIADMVTMVEKQFQL